MRSSSSSTRFSDCIPAFGPPMPKGRCQRDIHARRGTAPLTRTPHLGQAAEHAGDRAILQLHWHSGFARQRSQRRPARNRRSISSCRAQPHRHRESLTDAFPAHNGDEFLELLKSLAASDLSKPSDPANPSPLEKFLGSHPAALALVQAPSRPLRVFLGERLISASLR